jgi:hypothetical protein
MKNAAYYRTLVEVESRLDERMSELRQAESDVSLYCGPMAFDAASAEEVYRHALEHVGVPKHETDGLSASTLRVILKNLPRSSAGGAVRASSARMAYDSAEGPSALDGILKGIKPPRDSTTKNDRRRCL